MVAVYYGPVTAARVFVCACIDVAKPLNSQPRDELKRERFCLVCSSSRGGDLHPSLYGDLITIIPYIVYYLYILLSKY